MIGLQMRVSHRNLLVDLQVGLGSDPPPPVSTFARAGAFCPRLTPPGNKHLLDLDRSSGGMQNAQGSREQHHFQVKGAAASLTARSSLGGSPLTTRTHLSDIATVCPSFPTLPRDACITSHAVQTIVTFRAPGQSRCCSHSLWHVCNGWL